jgi:hypothetical protein
VVCSSSLRTRETLAAILPRSGTPSRSGSSVAPSGAGAVQLLVAGSRLDLCRNERERQVEDKPFVAPGDDQLPRWRAVGHHPKRVINDRHVSGLGELESHERGQEATVDLTLVGTLQPEMPSRPHDHRETGSTAQAVGMGVRYFLARRDGGKRQGLPRKRAGEPS